MKNIFKLPTGIVCIITILFAVGCNSQGPIPIVNPLVEVRIFLDTILINDTIHLEMRDSNGDSAIDNLYTDVLPGNTVIWDLDTITGIRKIKKIKGTNNIILHRTLRNILGHKPLILELKDNIKEGDEEKYDIVFKLEDNSRHKIDPFLRVPPGDIP